MKHIVFYSGGIGSWKTAKRVIEKHGKDDVILLFTDTLIEDDDLYRFIDETVLEMGVEFVRIAEGRSPFEIFKDQNFLGNSRVANCSKILKQRESKRWIKQNFKPDECILYLGIDWTEEHRTKAPIKNWSPYQVEFPMCEPPFLHKKDMLAELNELGIETPRLYKLGFAHNNCGGFCCRAGQGHFKHALDVMPERFAEWEQMEQEMIEQIGKDVSMMKRVVNGEAQTYTLKQLREDAQKDSCQIDMFDIGGCGCFVEDDELMIGGD